MDLVIIARSLGIHVHPVISALEAREMAQGRFDAAILDVEVPGAEELAEEMQKRMPTITLVGSVRRRIGRSSLAKPVTQNGIRLALHEALLPKNHKIAEDSLHPGRSSGFDYTAGGGQPGQPESCSSHVE